MASLSNVSGSLAGGSSIANAAIVATSTLTPDVKDKDGRSWTFAIRGEDRATLQAEATEHYVEKNSPTNDHMIIKPQKITLQGFSGELGSALPGSLQRLQNIASQLTVLSPFVPGLVSQATVQYNNLKQVFNAGASAVKTVEQLFGIGEDVNTQQRAYNFFKQRMIRKYLFDVLTPWELMKGMFIETLDAVQDEETQMVTEFSITFKEYRVVQKSLVIVGIDAQGRLAQIASSEVNQGQQNPPDVGALKDVLNSSAANGNGQIFGGLL